MDSVCGGGVGGGGWSGGEREGGEWSGGEYIVCGDGVGVCVGVEWDEVYIVWGGGEWG